MALSEGWGGGRRGSKLCGRFFQRTESCDWTAVKRPLRANLLYLRGSNWKAPVAPFPTATHFSFLADSTKKSLTLKRIFLVADHPWHWISSRRLAIMEAMGRGSGKKIKTQRLHSRLCSRKGNKIPPTPRKSHFGTRGRFPTSATADRFYLEIYWGFRPKEMGRSISFSQRLREKC